MANTTPREVFLRLLSELPKHGVAWRTMTKTYSVIEMKHLIENEDTVGLQWMSEALRVARDLIARQSHAATKPSLAIPPVATVRQASLVLFARYKAVLEVMPAEQVEYPSGTDTLHLLWMCTTAMTESNAWPEDKLSRWLGFVQGVMCSRGQLSVGIEREFSRPLFHASYTAAGHEIPSSVQPVNTPY